MRFELEKHQIEWQMKVREFCEVELAPNVRKYDEAEEFPWEIIEGLRRLGLLGIIFPKEYGGQGLDMVTYCLILEELGRADPSVALTVESHNSLAANHIFLAGTEEQKKKYLTGLAGGAVLGAWALTEPEAGSDAQSIKSKARLEDSQWVLNGSKTFTTQGSVAGIYVIFAKSGEREISAFVVEKGTPGLEVGKKEKKMGLRASDTAQIHLSNLRLPRESLLGQAGKAFKDAMRILDGGRAGISGISIGIARGALEEGVKWVKDRKRRFGIARENPGLTYAQKLLADVATEIEAARLLMLKSAWLLDMGQSAAKEGAMSKLFSGRIAVSAPTRVLDLFGEFGGGPDCSVEKLFRDAKLYEIGEGSTEIQELVISRHLLGRD